MSEEAAFAPATPLQRGMDALSNVAIAVAVAALLGLVVVQGWQVIARYVINDSPSWTEPVTVLLLTTAMSLGAAAGVHTNRHFGFFLLADFGPPRSWIERAVGRVLTHFEHARTNIQQGLAPLLADAGFRRVDEQPLRSMGVGRIPVTDADSVSTATSPTGNA